MNVSYGQFGLTDEEVLDQVSFELPKGYRRQYNIDQRQRYRSVHGGSAAEDVTGITTGIGTMTSGIADLIGQLRGGRRRGGRRRQGQDQQGQPRNDQGVPSGVAILGVGAMLMLGLFAMAAMTGGGKKSSRSL